VSPVNKIGRGVDGYKKAAIPSSRIGSKLKSVSEIFCFECFRKFSVIISYITGLPCFLIILLSLTNSFKYRLATERLILNDSPISLAVVYCLLLFLIYCKILSKRFI